MRVKHLWAYLPLPSHIRLVWDRLTATRLTIAYFVFSLCHFVTQVSFQSKAFAINQEAAGFLYDIVVQGNTTTNGFAVFRDDLRICDEAPSNFSTASCRVVWNGSSRQNSVSSPDAVSTMSPTPVSTPASGTPLLSTSQTLTSSPTPSISVIAGITLTPTVIPTARPSAPVVRIKEDSDDDESDTESVDSLNSVSSGSDDNDLQERWSLLDEEEDEKHWRILSVTEDGHAFVKLNGMGYSNVDADLDSSCLWALNWPVNILNNTKREDIVFIAFQFWLFGMSLVALLNESIPHIAASLVAHLLATVWAAFQITHTAHFRSDFNHLIANGACKGAQLLPNYWRERVIFEFIALGFNVLFLLLSAFFTYRLLKLFGWQTFKRIGASLVMNRLYKIVLSLSILIQVSLFFMAVTTGLWIDQLYNGAIGHLATMHMLYKVMFIITLILLVPWIFTGWFSVRREQRIGMLVFLGITVWYLAGVNSMFFATTFRWSFLQWRFFSIMVVISIVLALTVFILALVARCNFGRGLPMYLKAHQPLPDHFEPVSSEDVEKFNFPNEEPIPTFSAAFGNSNAYVPPSEWHVEKGHLQATKPNQGLSVSPAPSIGTLHLSPPQMAYTKPRLASDESHGAAGVSVQRYDSKWSSDSSSYHYRSNSQTSSKSSTSVGSRSTGEGSLSGKRWVIE